MGKSAIKPSAALATIRHIAMLGYSGELVLPSLLEAMRDIVSYERVNFMWVDEHCGIRDVYDPNVVPLHLTKLYFERYYNSLESQFMPLHVDVMTKLGIDRSATLPKFHGSEIFHEIVRPGGLKHYMRLAIRSGAQPIGFVQLLRGPQMPDFTQRDEQLASRAMPWLAHALAARPLHESKESLVDGEDGLIITDKAANILAFSHGAKELLYRAAGVPINIETLIDENFNWAHKLIASIVHSAGAATNREAEGIPVRTLRSPAGTFQFRAYWVDGASCGASGRFAIQIQRQIPLLLKLMQSAGVRALPPREQQACLLLAQGLSSTEISQRMGITLNGAIYHTRALYDRFGISRREELVSTLLAQPSLS